jgi:DNA-binding response OmpR family regulator
LNKSTIIYKIRYAPKEWGISHIRLITLEVVFHLSQVLVGLLDLGTETRLPSLYLLSHFLIGKGNHFGSENASNQIKLGKYILDADHATLKDTQDGKQKMLTAREAKILELLAVNKNEVVRREAVLSRFWGVEDKDYFASRSLDVFIKKIRTALEDEPGVELKTIRGVGFKLIAE